MSDKYKDPKNEELLKALHKQLIIANNVDKILLFVNDLEPTWLIREIHKFAKMYNVFTQNWKLLCTNLNVESKSILLVDEIRFSEKEYTLMQEVCELLTRSGYCVRRACEFTECKICKCAILSPGMFQTLSKIQKDRLGILPTYDPESGLCSDCAI